MFNTNRSSSKKSISLALVVLVGTAVALPALAHRGGKGGEGLTDEQRTERRAKRQARAEQRIRADLAPKIGLDEAQTDRLIASLKTLDEQRKAAHQNVRQQRQALADLVDAGANEGQLSAQMARVAAAQEAMPQRGALLDETARFLSTEQQAKLMLELPKMKRHGKRGHHGKRGKRGKRSVERQGGFGGAEDMTDED